MVWVKDMTAIPMKNYQTPRTNFNLFFFFQEKLKLNAAKSLSALSRFLSRTLQFQMFGVFLLYQVT